MPPRQRTGFFFHAETTPVVIGRESWFVEAVVRLLSTTPDRAVLDDDPGTWVVATTHVTGVVLGPEDTNRTLILLGNEPFRIKVVVEEVVRAEVVVIKH